VEPREPEPFVSTPPQQLPRDDAKLAPSNGLRSAQPAQLAIYLVRQLSTVANQAIVREVDLTRDVDVSAR
jgi:hypothetical protein